MATRPDSLETTRLTIELLRRIPSNRPVSAMELHTQLNEAGFTRDLRSIQRLLDVLSDHYEIERNTLSKPYGYQWKPNSRGLSLQVMNEQESLLLALAERYLRNLLPTSVMVSMEAFFDQAHRNLLPTPMHSDEQEWLQKVRVVNTTPELIPPTIRPGVMEAVSNALFKNYWLEVDYRNAKQHLKKNAKVMPLGLVQQGVFLYLVCRFDGFDNERNLVLHRLEAARSLELPFERPQDFNLARYDDDGRFHWGNGNRVQVTFDLKKEVGYHLLEAKLSKDQTVDEVGDCYRFTATVVTGILFWNWLKGLGGVLVGQPIPVLKGIPATS